jgi:hypothetical protein
MYDDDDSERRWLRQQLSRAKSIHNAWSQDWAERFASCTVDQLLELADCITNNCEPLTVACFDWQKLRDDLALWSLHREISRRIEIEVLERGIL